jgi:hypothetical protein
MTELRKPEGRRSSDFQLYGLEFNYVLSLSPLGTLDYLKFHFLVFGQGAKAFALDGAVMHEDIGTAIPADEAEALGIVKPLHGTCCHVLYILKKTKKGLAPWVGRRSRRRDDEGAKHRRMRALHQTTTALLEDRWPALCTLSGAFANKSLHRHA